MKQALLDHFMAEVEDVKQGNKNALDVAPELKEFSDALSDLYDELEDDIVEERQKYNDKEEVIRGGYEIRVQSRSYPQYKQDNGYSILKEKVKARKSLIKKAIQKGQGIMDPETGELIEPVDVKERMYPVLKYVGQNEV